MRKLSCLILFVLCILSTTFYAQSDLSNLFDESEDKPKEVFATFKSSRLINAQTIEQIKKHELDFRITHRFDDIAGARGGVSTLFGFDNVSDIRIAFLYGLSDDLMIGFGRSKGSEFSKSPKKVLDGIVKYKILRQNDKNIPLSLSVMASTELSTQTKSSILSNLNSFPKGIHRLSYVVQAIAARKFSKNFSLEVLPTFIHRNFVLNGDENSNFGIGAGGRIKISKRMAFIFDYFHIFSDYRKENNRDVFKYFAPLGVGLEIETGGHVFQLNFSNSAGIIESQFIPYNNNNWLDGQFRFGFNISRVFQL